MLASITATVERFVGAGRLPRAARATRWPAREIVAAGAVAGCRIFMGGMTPEARGKRHGGGRAGGRGQFDRRPARIDRLVHQQAGRGGRGHRQHAVLGVHRAAADVEGRADGSYRSRAGRTPRTRPRYRRSNRPRRLRGSALFRWGPGAPRPPPPPAAERPRWRCVGTVPGARPSRSSSRCATDAGARAAVPRERGTWWRRCRERFTFSKDTTAPASSEPMALMIAAWSAPASASAPTSISPLMPEKASR